MAKKTTSKPRQYGRQAEGKTIKSLSLETEVAEWAEAEAKKQGVSFSAFVNNLLKGGVKLLFFIACCSALFHFASGKHPLEAALYGIGDAFKAAFYVGQFAAVTAFEITKAVLS
jgi:hypothetical protein